MHLHGLLVCACVVKIAKEQQKLEWRFIISSS